MLNMSTILRQNNRLAPARGKTTVPHVFFKDLVKQHGRLMALRIMTIRRQETKARGYATGVFIPKDDRHGREGIVYTEYKRLVGIERTRRAELRIVHSDRAERKARLAN